MSTIPAHTNPKQRELNQEEVLRFVKSYYFSTDRYPTQKMVSRYTTLDYEKIVTEAVVGLEKKKKLIVDRTHKEAILILP